MHEQQLLMEHLAIKKKTLALQTIIKQPQYKTILKFLRQLVVEVQSCKLKALIAKLKLPGIARQCVFFFLI